MKKLYFFLILLVLLSSCEQEQHVHDFNCGRLLERTEPSCMLDGYEIRLCSGCDAQQITKLDAIGSHNSDEGTIAMVSGHEMTTYKCTRCNVVIKKVQEHRLEEKYCYDGNNHWKEYACGCEGQEQEACHLWSIDSQTVTTTSGTQVQVTQKTCQICDYKATPTVEII